ncbi:MAG: Na+/H+ antiporter NhaC [Parabacteroides sp.]
MDKQIHPQPSIGLSLLPVGVLVALLALVIYIFGGDALNGGSQVVLLLATALCACIARFRYQVSWASIESTITQNIYGIAPSILILLLIGMLSAIWMVSGVVPCLIYYGLQILQTHFFLVACCVLCAIVSVMTGSSWTTIATIGIALVGIGEAQGFHTGWIAGAIISGAYFGDKMSPLSDTTVLAASVTGTPLFEHIRYMLFTTVPSVILSLIVFSIAGFTTGTADAAQIQLFSEALQNCFHISPWLLVVPLITAVLIAKQIPSIVVLFVSSMAAGLFALFFQQHVLVSISGLEEGGCLSLVKGLLMTFYDSTHVDTGNEALNELISTRGMSGMMNTIWLIICAMCFGGAMSASGMLGSLTRLFLHFMKGPVSTVASTVVSGLSLNICTSDQFIAIILNSEMFKKVYQEKGYESRLLSRTTEDAVTVTSVLIPWTTCGMTQATILGVSTWTYFPYCIFNLVSPLMSILVAATGYRIYRHPVTTGKTI